MPAIRLSLRYSSPTSPGPSLLGDPLCRVGRSGLIASAIGLASADACSFLLGQTRLYSLGDTCPNSPLTPKEEFGPCSFRLPQCPNILSLSVGFFVCFLNQIVISMSTGTMLGSALCLCPPAQWLTSVKHLATNECVKRRIVEFI